MNFGLGPFVAGLYTDIIYGDFPPTAAPLVTTLDGFLFPAMPTRCLLGKGYVAQSQ